MHRAVEAFLEEVCSFIRYRGVHSEIKEELTLHIEESAAAYTEKGCTPEEAAGRAIADMGSADEIGRRLDRQHRLQTEWVILLLTVLISLFGILVMYVSSHFENRPVSFVRHLLHVGLGAAALAGVYFADYTRLKKHPGILFSAAVCLLVFCALFGAEYAGVRRWIRLGGMSISVNAITGILFVTAFCGFMEKYRGEGFAGIAKMMLWGAISLLLFVMQPSMSMVLILLVVYAVLLLRAVSVNHFAGNQRLQMLSLLSAGGFMLLLSVLFVLQSPYRVERLLMFWTKGAGDPRGGGWIYAMADRLLKSSSPVGQAAPLAEGSIDWVMPEITTDFALLNFINSFGWIAGALLILTILVFIVRLFVTTNRVKSTFGLYLSLASCVVLTVQFTINVLFNLGLFPYIGVSLPFISYGGSDYIANMIYVGLIVSVWRKNNVLAQTQRPAAAKEKMITFADHKLIIDFGKNKTKKV